MGSDEILVTLEGPARSKKMLGLSLGGVRIPEVQPGEHLYLVTRQDGVRAFRHVEPGGPAEGNSLFYRVRLNQYRFSPVLAGSLQDEAGQSWDCAFSGSFTFVDPARCLSAFAADLTSLNAPLSRGLAESWITGHIAPCACDALKRYTPADLRNDTGLPLAWWEQELNDWLRECGVEVRIVGVEWRSAEAEAAEAAAARQRDLERVAVARAREQEIELRASAAVADYKKQKRALETDLQVSDLERAQRLELLEKRHRKERLEADTALENAQREAERAALEHEATLARLRNDLEASERVEARNREMDARHDCMMAELATLKQMLGHIAGLPGNLLAQLAAGDQDAYAAAENLVSPVHNIPAGALAGLGFDVPRTRLTELLRARQTVGAATVTLHKVEMVARDIGTARVQALPVNSPLRFEFTTGRGGYVTALNIGTSGAVYVHVPNGYVSPGEAKVVSGRAYAIPGEELLPPAQLRRQGLDYVEIGPPGWEHLAVIVSDVPLIDGPVYARAGENNLFIRLSNAEISRLYETLESADPDAWSGGILSFLVG